MKNHEEDIPGRLFGWQQLIQMKCCFSTWIRLFKYKLHIKSTVYIGSRILSWYVHRERLKNSFDFGSVYL